MVAKRIGFIGFGEAASAFVSGWRTERPIDVAAYDILFDNTANKGRKREDCLALGVEPIASARELAASVDLVFSAVTAEQALVAARSVLPGARRGSVYLDINSAAPFRKQEAKTILAAGGVGYIDVAVMNPVHPRRHKTPLLVSGADAAAVAPVLAGLGMVFEVVSERVGDASTIKMVRSVAIKGIESVIMECVVAAAKLGVSDRVLPSVAAAYTNIDFRAKMDYMLERVVVHGKRRAEEMREVAATLEHAGLTNFTASATARQQQFVADFRLAADFGADVSFDAERIAAAFLKRLEAGPAGALAKLARKA